MSGDGVTGVEVDNVSMRTGPSTVNVHYDRDIPTNERERVQWRDRQLKQLRYAMLGDEEFGVNGLVDSVRNQRRWLIVLSVAVGLILLLLLYQQFQIHLVLERLAQMAG